MACALYSLVKQVSVIPNLAMTGELTLTGLVMPVGGIKEKTPSSFFEKNKPEEILKLAVKRMLPRGPLSKKQLTKLKIYASEKHPHNAQKVENIDFGKLNKKNMRSN